MAGSRKSPQHFYNKFEMAGCYGLLLMGKKIILVTNSN